MSSCLVAQNNLGERATPRTPNSFGIKNIIPPQFFFFFWCPSQEKQNQTPDHYDHELWGKCVGQLVITVFMLLAQHAWASITLKLLKLCSLSVGPELALAAGALGMMYLISHFSPPFSFRFELVFYAPFLFSVSVPFHHRSVIILRSSFFVSPLIVVVRSGWPDPRSPKT